MRYSIEYRQIIVRDGKGQKDRLTLLPDALAGPLQMHWADVRILHDQEERYMAKPPLALNSPPLFDLSFLTFPP